MQKIGTDQIKLDEARNTTHEKNKKKIWRKNKNTEDGVVFKGEGM